MKEKILVVDDDPMMHKLVGFTLSGQYELVSKFNGEEAQAYLTDHYKHIDALILDWEMPGMNGLELLDRLKKNDELKDIPVMMLTAHSTKKDIQMGIDAGAHYYLTKPLNKDLLRSVTQAAILDYKNLRQLNQRLLAAQNPLRNLSSGIFKIQTLEEAQSLSVYLANASASPEETLMICELLNNAIEHGNLGITYQEKTQLIDEEELMLEIERRLAEKQYCNKYATIEFTHNEEYIAVMIEDEGVGFDFKKYLSFDQSRVFDNHGRGIAMANSMLNINYLGKGNKVEIQFPRIEIAA